MTRSDIVENVRTQARQYNNKPITDDAIFNAIARAVDDLSNKCPFLMAIDRGNTVVGQMEYPTAVDILEVMEVFYRAASGTLLATTITSGTMTVVGATNISTFSTSGSLKIGSEIMTYSAKVDATKTFTITARGTESTTAAAHDAGVGVIEAGIKPVRLTPTSPQRLSLADESYIEAENSTPTMFYMFEGILGFDVPPDVNGFHNFIMRNFVRPPALIADDSVISGLIESFNNVIVAFGVSKVLMMLGQDQQTIIQANMFMGEYVSGLADFKRIKHLYVRGDEPQIRPFTGRV